MILQDLKLNEQNLLLRYRDRNLDRANKPPYNKVLSMANYSLNYPSNSKPYEKEPQYNETSLERTNFANPLALRYIHCTSNLSK